jgi:TldD protein
LKRKDFLQLSGMGAGGLLLGRIPLLGSPVPPDKPLETVDTALKKRMADIALNAARSKGATYADVRIGRYRNQFIITREDKVLNTVDTESYGMGIRVIADGCWGFSATDKLDTDGIAQAAALAVAIAKENARLQSEPVQLAPQKGIWRSQLEDPDRKERLRSADQRKDRPAAGRQCRRHEERRQLSSTRPSSSSMNKNISLLPTDHISTRTSTASGLPSP